jgi:hypothetical protein
LPSRARRNDRSRDGLLEPDELLPLVTSIREQRNRPDDQELEREAEDDGAQPGRERDRGVHGHESRDHTRVDERPDGRREPAPHQRVVDLSR